MRCKEGPERYVEGFEAIGRIRTVERKLLAGLDAPRGIELDVLRPLLPPAHDVEESVARGGWRMVEEAQIGRVRKIGSVDVIVLVGAEDIRAVLRRVTREVLLLIEHLREMSFGQLEVQREGGVRRR